MHLGAVLRFLLLLVVLTVCQAVPDDKHEQCAAWADSGECDQNAAFMASDCATSCNRVAEQAEQAKEDLAAVSSFFDLKASDIDGNAISFSEFKGKVTILTNVASYCGYTESHYKGLVELWSQVKDENIEVLAFPCNQFGKQEPGTAEEIKNFAASKGVHFRMMEKIDVNGPHASLVYKFLKREAGPNQITWNFATYYVVGPGGAVESHSGIEPMDLKSVAFNLLEKEEL